jgi:two-component system phosphate regulon response regulator PhoB
MEPREMTQCCVLVVEDDGATREMLRLCLKQAGLQSREAANSEEALASLAKQRPSLILLDWMLPTASGIEFLGQLRCNSEGQRIPVILLTARDEEDDRVYGLECGADDYITKPFSKRELLARIRSILRRTAPEFGGQVVAVEGLCLSLESHRVTADGVPLELRPMEFRLLHFFMAHPNRVYSAAHLVNKVWEKAASEAAATICVFRLRELLAPFGYDRLIRTVRGGGYRFTPTGERGNDR